MAEKVIFEFHIDQTEGGCKFEFGPDVDEWIFGPAILARCKVMGFPGAPWACGSKRPTRQGDKVRHHMRETLNFFERMYDDLFGGEELSESENSESD